MREHDFGRRSDRSYFCLLAIYVIHALLLNVFLQPQIDVRSSVTLSSSYVRAMSRESLYSEINSSETIMASTDNTGQEEISSASTFNSTNYHAERRKRDDDDYSVDSSANLFLQQSRSDGEAIRFLAASASKAAGVSGITNNALDIARTIVKSLSPAALGILAGCLVFLLTFTENDYV